jgi:Cu-processing system permease protein
MLLRVSVVMFNTYREAVRARILLGLFAVAMATAGYTLVVAEYAHRDATRIISNVGGLSVSLYSVFVAVVLGATSLYREIELKTVFPILARPIRRGEYLTGKFLGALLTLSVFIAANTGVLLACLRFVSSGHGALAPALLLASAAVFGALALRFGRSRTWLPLGWAVVVLALGTWLASDAAEDRQALLSSALLSWFEVSIVIALATLFSSFSTPFMTAVFTVAVFVVGRSADTLAKLPPKVFGQAIHDLGAGLAHVFPNLMVYVPPRPLLVGEVLDVPLAPYLALAGAQALAWTVGLLVCSGFLFSRRDFT